MLEAFGEESLALMLCLCNNVCVCVFSLGFYLSSQCCMDLHLIDKVYQLKKILSFLSCVNKDFLTITAHYKQNQSINLPNDSMWTLTLSEICRFAAVLLIDCIVF